MRISFIVVMWNSAKWIVPCLESIYAQSEGLDEVIVVDNASSDGSADLVAERFPRARLIRSAENLGFAEGNNVALPHARARYVALVNGDAALERGWADKMLAFMEADPKIGICASRIVRADRPEVIDAIGDGITTAFTAFKRGEGDVFGPPWDEPERLFGACAAGALYRKAMLDEIGLFDPDFFLLHEDSDLNFRANLAGWKCAYNPAAVTRHQVSGHLNKVPDKTIYYTQRNVEWLWVKNVPWSWALRQLPSRIAYELCAFVYYCLRLGCWRTYFRAKRDAVAGLPRMWRKRRGLQARRKITYREFAGLMTPFFSYRVLSNRFRKLLNPPEVFLRRPGT